MATAILPVGSARSTRCWAAASRCLRRPTPHGAGIQPAGLPRHCTPDKEGLKTGLQEGGDNEYSFPSSAWDGSHAGPLGNRETAAMTPTVSSSSGSLHLFEVELMSCTPASVGGSPVIISLLPAYPQHAHRLFRPKPLDSGSQCLQLPVSGAAAMS